MFRSPHITSARLQSSSAAANRIEFANSAMDSVPLAPEGMKFVIDPVDKAVKVVKKQP